VLVVGSHYKRPTLKRRLYETGLKQPLCELCGSRRGVAGAAHVADPRSHQRRRDGQPPREPADRLSELQRDARDALRSQQAARSSRVGRVRALWRALSRAAPSAALLLANLRRAARRP
jgi:hypothetical protein